MEEWMSRCQSGSSAVSEEGHCRIGSGIGTDMGNDYKLYYHTTVLVEIPDSL